VGTALVHEHKLPRIDSSYLLAPALSLLFIALSGYKALFLSGSPSLLNARLMLALETLTL
jgi:hypothetical protein